MRLQVILNFHDSHRPVLHRTALLAGVCALSLATCSRVSDPSISGVVRLESTLSGNQFNELRLQISQPGDAAPFYDTTWRVGTAALPALPAEVIVLKGRGDVVHVIAEARLETFVVDHQEGDLRLHSDAERKLVLVLGPRFMCGNGRSDDSEECDCGTIATKPGHCEHANDNSWPGACREDCRRAFCGDGVVDPGEACDASGTGGTCTSGCRLNVCGDGIPLPGTLCFEPASPSAHGSTNVLELFAVSADDDGLVDLMTRAAVGPTTLFMHRNAGQAVFEAPRPVTIAGTASYRMEPARLTQDTLTDLVFYSAQYAEIVTAVAQGAGAFTVRRQPPWPTGPAPPAPFTWNWVVGRVDGDTLDDVILTHKESGRLDVLLADGRGGWASRAALALPPAEADVTSGALGDLDADGDADLVLGYRSQANVGLAVWMADGSGGFARIGTTPTHQENVMSYALSIVPLHIDAQHLDVLVTSSYGVSAYLGDGRGGFVQAPHPYVASALIAPPLQLADFEGNGRQEVLLPNLLQVLAIAEDGSLAPLPRADRFKNISQVPHAVVADFDSDGLPDIARTFSYLSPNPSPFEVYLNRP